jgi:hypothetical protein
MKVSGFTFVKDAVKYDFPVVESIKSMLPLCDELFVNVGISGDNTLELVKSIKSNKINIIQSEWDPDFKVKGRILAVQTNIALYKCRGDWCIYLQADEVLHQKDYDAIRKSMKENLDDKSVEGLLLNYRHFFGDYKHYAKSYHWYQKEIRIIRNHMGIQSWRSAQTFRVDGRKLKVKECPAYVYHYGWVRDPYKMAEKKKYHNSLHHGSRDNPQGKLQRYYYEDNMDPYMFTEFKGEHPEVMKEKVDNWKYDTDPVRLNKKKKMSFKDVRYRITDFIYYKTGLKIGEYRNYKLLKDRQGD